MPIGIVSGTGHAERLVVAAEPAEHGREEARRSPSRPPPSPPPSARPVARRARRSAIPRCARPAAASPAARDRRPARATARPGAPRSRPAEGRVSSRDARRRAPRGPRAPPGPQHPDRVRDARHRRRGLRPQRVVLAGPAVQARHELDRAEAVGGGVVGDHDVRRSRRPARPSTSSARHSGRSRSNGLRANSCTRSSSSRCEPPIRWARRHVLGDVDPVDGDPRGRPDARARARPPADASAAPSARPTRARPAAGPTPG